LIWRSGPVEARRRRRSSPELEFPRRRLTGDGRTRPSGGQNGWDLGQGGSTRHGDPLVALARFEQALGRERGCDGGSGSYRLLACTRAVHSGARVSVQQDRGACARHEQPETRIEQGWGALQGICHGGAGTCAVAGTPACGVPALRVRHWLC